MLPDSLATLLGTLLLVVAEATVFAVSLGVPETGGSPLNPGNNTKAWKTTTAKIPENIIRTPML